VGYPLFRVTIAREGCGTAIGPHKERSRSDNERQVVAVQLQFVIDQAR
jgi:hypothetical protein